MVANESALRLTGEQHAQFLRACAQSVPGAPVAPTQISDTQAAITRLYRAVGLPQPIFIWVNNPLQLIQVPMLLQSVVSNPHGSPRRQLKRSGRRLPPVDLDWQLARCLKGTWARSFALLAEQLTPAARAQLSQNHHMDAMLVSPFDEPDVMSTCGARAGFPLMAALTSLREDVIRDARSRIWTSYSPNVAKELVNIYHAHSARRIWNVRMPFNVTDFGSSTGPLRKIDSGEFFAAMTQELAYEFVSLQDTGCHHPRVDGTSALKASLETGSDTSASDPEMRFWDASFNPVYNATWGCWSRDEIPIFQTAERLLGDIYNPYLSQMLQDFAQLRNGAFAYVFNSRVVFACAKPTACLIDEGERLHNFSGPAICFNDDYDLHFWRGLPVDDAKRAYYLTLRADEIEQERNAELRRVLIERYGTARFLSETGARLIQEDSFGRLYSKALLEDEAIQMVRVINSTPEPDGTFKEYWLRVPPSIETARSAVAWTFGVQAFDYAPEVES